MIEFPLARSHQTQTALTMINNPQAALPSSTDYITDGNPAVQGFYFPGDWLQPRKGQGLEDFYAEEIRLRSLEMLEDDDLQRVLKTV